ncbi:MAG: ribulose-phosphate 3-epimerase [Actinobacteria bacterium]|nr:ribulose-phosphate 3-epimerase [Actinomycetota bacterium]
MNNNFFDFLSKEKLKKTKFASLLYADASDYLKIINFLEKENFEGLHFDVTDGHFVKNFSFNQYIINSLRKHTKLIFDTHLELESPGDFIDMFIKAGSDIISIHPQMCKKLDRELRYLKANNITSSVVLEPDIDLEYVRSCLSLIDNIIVMGAYLGFDEQKFIEQSIVKIKKIKKIIIDNNLNIKIAIEGGINKNNLNKILEAGVDIIVFDSFLFKD